MSVPGNQNAKRGKHWRDALRAELATYEDKGREVERGHALRKIARKVVEQALDGEEAAIREIANRLDGKPVQMQEIGVEINARIVLQSYVAKYGEGETRKLLATAAPNLLPMLEQLKATDAEFTEHAG